MTFGKESSNHTPCGCSMQVTGLIFHELLIFSLHSRRIKQGGYIERMDRQRKSQHDGPFQVTLGSESKPGADCYTRDRQENRPCLFLSTIDFVVIYLLFKLQRSSLPES